MEIKHISGFTRVIGEEQGYTGLPLRYITLNDSVTGPDTPAMESAWEPDLTDLAVLKAGGKIVLRVLGKQHPPVALYVEMPGETADQAEVHNNLAGEIVRAIVEPILSGGGQFTDVMVLTESILVGVALAGVRFGGDEKALDIMVKNARDRLAEIRLKDVETAGSA